MSTGDQNEDMRHWENLVDKITSKTRANLGLRAKFATHRGRRGEDAGTSWEAVDIGFEDGSVLQLLQTVVKDR